jgi:hypothetical protein
MVSKTRRQSNRPEKTSGAKTVRSKSVEQQLKIARDIISRYRQALARLAK